MPIFDLKCHDCGNIWEFLFIRSDEFPECPKCGGKYYEKLIACPLIRMDSDQILKSLPDPSPPLQELIGKNKPGHEGGYKELEGTQAQLKDYTYKLDKYGNKHWYPKERLHIDMGRDSCAKKE